VDIRRGCRVWCGFHYCDRREKREVRRIYVVVVVSGVVFITIEERREKLGGYP